MQGISRSLQLALCALVALCWSPTDAMAQDRTPEQFKEYVNGRLPGQLDEKQLNRFVELVDVDGDGTISESEFENRMEALQKIRDGEMDQDDSKQGDKADAKQEKKDAEKDKEKDEDEDKAKRRDRFKEMNERMQKRLDEAGIVPGKPLPDVEGLDIDGNPFKLSSLKGNYSVIVNGCLT